MAGFLLSLLIILLAIGGLAVGVLLGRPPIRGSCGGVGCGGCGCGRKAEPPR